MAWWQWSRTASSNSNADPSINFTEGMSPSSVNDSARAVMARAAEFRDDSSGLLTSGGFSTAYTLTTYQANIGATPTTGQLLAFTPHATNGAVPTLAVDGGTAFALQSSPGIAVSAAVLVQGSPYTVMFNGTAWVLRNFYGNPFTVPIGGFIPYVGSTAPNSNFALPSGQAISRTTYAALFTLIGTTYGVGDGVTTFNIPDLRGRVIAGLDNMGGTTAGRITNAESGIVGTTMGAAGGAQSVTLTVAQMPSHTHTATVSDPGHAHDTNMQTSQATAAGSGGRNIETSTGQNTDSTTTGITVSNSSTGGGASHSVVQPTIIMTYIMRVL